MNKLDSQNIDSAKSHLGTTRPQTPRELPAAWARKQITEQLELALDMAYQLTFAVMRKTHRVAKKIVPMVPYMVQLCLDLVMREKKKSWWQKAKQWLVGIWGKALKPLKYA